MRITQNYNHNTYTDTSTSPLLKPPLQGTVPTAGPSIPTPTQSVSSFAPPLPGPSSPPATESGMHTDRFAFSICHTLMIKSFSIPPTVVLVTLYVYLVTFLGCADSALT